LIVWGRHPGKVLTLHGHARARRNGRSAEGVRLKHPTSQCQHKRRPSMQAPCALVSCGRRPPEGKYHAGPEAKLPDRQKARPVSGPRQSTGQRSHHQHHHTTHRRDGNTQRERGPQRSPRSTSTSAHQWLPGFSVQFVTIISPRTLMGRQDARTLLYNIRSSVERYAQACTTIRPAKEVLCTHDSHSESPHQTRFIQSHNTHTSWSTLVKRVRDQVRVQPTVTRLFAFGYMGGVASPHDALSQVLGQLPD